MVSADEKNKHQTHRAHNIRQIKNAVFRGELSLKGTAPSFFNNESDRGKPGSESPLSGKGYDHLEAVVPTEDNEDIPEEEMNGFIVSARKIYHGLAHIRRTKWDLYRAILRVQNDPGIVKRWENGTEQDSGDWLRSYEMACKEAAEYVEAIWPGTRLYVPTKREVDEVESKAEEEQRAPVLTVHDSYRRIAREVRSLQMNHEASEEAAKAMVSERWGFSIPRIESALEFAESEEAS